MIRRAKKIKAAKRVRKESSSFIPEPQNLRAMMKINKILIINMLWEIWKIWKRL